MSQRRNINDTDEAVQNADWALGIFESSLNMVCLCDKGKINYINTAGLEMLGLKSAKRAAGRDFSEFVHPDYRDIVAELMEGGHTEPEPFEIKLIGRAHV